MYQIDQLYQIVHSMEDAKDMMNGTFQSKVGEKHHTILDEYKKSEKPVVLSSILCKVFNKQNT